jgi:hypothetical protein
MLCDQNSPDNATVFTYTGDGLKYNNHSMVELYPGGPLVLGESGWGNSQLDFPPAPTGTAPGTRQAAFSVPLLAARYGVCADACSPLQRRRRPTGPRWTRWCPSA